MPRTADRAASRRARSGPASSALAALVALAAALAFAFAGPAAAQAAADRGLRPQGPLGWPEEQRAFLQDGPGLLLTAAQRSELLGLDEAGRQRFIERFLADPLPATPDNELVTGIERRAALGGAEFPSPTDVRWQLLFLRGTPVERLVIDCGVTYKPLEVWRYGPEGRSSTGDVRAVVVYEPAPGDPWRLWLPHDAKRALYSREMEYWLDQWEELRGEGLMRARRFDLTACKETRRVEEATGVLALTGYREDRPRAEDYQAYLAAPTDLAAWAARAAATPAPPEPPRLALGDARVFFPERHGQLVVTRVVVSLPPDSGALPAATPEPTSVVEAAAPAFGTPLDEPVAELAGESGDHELRLLVEGLLEQGGRVHDTFRARFRPRAGGEEPLDLVVDRPLRPGLDYLLRLTVRDEVSGAARRSALAFRVPPEPQPLPAPAPGVQVVAGDLGGDPSRSTADTVTLLPPSDDVVLGLWRAQALVTGERIARVAFLVDGEPQLSRNRPPYSAELRLARFPREQVIRVEGYDAEGDLVAADQVVLNQPRGRLRVLVVEPPRGARVHGEVPAHAEVTVPDGRRVERVEFRLNDAVLASLEAPPWRTTVQVPSGDEIAYLTVIAFLDDGSQAEDVRFLNAPGFVEELDVSLVELYASAVDGRGEPVSGLGAEDFEVLEQGRPQTLARFEEVRNLPLTVGMLIDTSGSMTSSLVEAQRAAQEFLRDVIRPSDQSFAVAFDDRVNLLMPPTDDVEAVSGALQGLRAQGATALHDAIVRSLYLFRGLEGQKALVLLSDGDDTTSSLEFDDALEYARRAGVAVYTIGLGVGRTQILLRGKLEQLAAATGGRSFFISKADELSGTLGELAGVYDEIENELRSRYLLAYAPDEPPTAGEFRPVEVRVLRRGVSARAPKGYYR
ncbi:MAG TPA: VWA domain-containing protein [Thermoanaerobaculia bacterium]|nr:VWA domain-containing protein [Thermoanaerobaculia bacterium]